MKIQVIAPILVIVQGFIWMLLYIPPPTANKLPQPGQQCSPPPFLAAVPHEDFDKKRAQIGRDFQGLAPCLREYTCHPSSTLELMPFACEMEDLSYLLIMAASLLITAACLLITAASRLISAASLLITAANLLITAARLL
jgi:hypothetical protein